MKRRKVTYPAARTATRGVRSAATGDEIVRPNLVTIDLSVATASRDFAIGDRVRIAGSGLYAGESAVVETVVGGVIPSAHVRTDAGFTRRVRAVDLHPVRNDP